MNLSLKLDDLQLRSSFGLQLGANLCVAHKCHCGKKKVERDGLQGLSCTISAGLKSLKSLMKVGISRFLDSIQDLIDSLESKLNLWYLGQEK